MLALGDCGHGNSFTIFLYLRYCFLTQGQDLHLSRNFGLIFFRCPQIQRSDPYFHYAELITINNVGIFVSSLFIPYSVFKTYTVELCEKKNTMYVTVCVHHMNSHTHTCSNSCGFLLALSQSFQIGRCCVTNCSGNNGITKQ